jgi:aconitate hydratase
MTPNPPPPPSISKAAILRRRRLDDHWMKMTHGDIVIAAITSCTNTSNPQRDDRRRFGRQKSRRARPESSAVCEDQPLPRLARRHRIFQQGRPDQISRQARLPNHRLRLHDLHRQQRPAARSHHRRHRKSDLVAAAVLSGNRNFEGRINPNVKANYLASPPLVVAFALAGTVDINIMDEPIAKGAKGEARLSPRHLADAGEVQRHHRRLPLPEMFKKQYANVAEQATRSGTPSPSKAASFSMGRASTYIQEPPFFTNLAKGPAAISRSKARACW